MLMSDKLNTIFPIKQYLQFENLLPTANVLYFFFLFFFFPQKVQLMYSIGAFEGSRRCKIVNILSDKTRDHFYVLITLI